MPENPKSGDAEALLDVAIADRLRSQAKSRRSQTTSVSVGKVAREERSQISNTESQILRGN